MMGNRGGWIATGVVLTMLGASAPSCAGQIKADATDGGRAPSAGPGPGDEGGRCLADGGCTGDLWCVTQTCVDIGDEPDPGIDAADPGIDANLTDFDAPFDAFTNITTYERLGGHAGITNLVKVGMEGSEGVMSDAQLFSYFAIRTGGIGTGGGGAPSLAVVEECFTHFLARAAGGLEPYPFITASGFVCRDMATAHAGLAVVNMAMQRFVTILATQWTALGVSNADLQVLGGALLGTSSDVVDQQRSAQQVDAGLDAAFSYGAYCTSIVGGSAVAPGCVP